MLALTSILPILCVREKPEYESKRIWSISTIENLIVSWKTTNEQIDKIAFPELKAVMSSLT